MHQPRCVESVPLKVGGQGTVRPTRLMAHAAPALSGLIFVIDQQYSLGFDMPHKIGLIKIRWLETAFTYKLGLIGIVFRLRTVTLAPWGGGE